MENKKKDNWRGNIILISLIGLSGYLISYLFTPKNKNQIQKFSGQVAGHLWQEGESLFFFFLKNKIEKEMNNFKM